MIKEIKPDYSFLKNGGEMGKLTRQFDWASTAIGSPETWPQSLKTLLSVILNSRFPMFLWWGDDLIQFYNDAYRPSLGINGKHPKALGQQGEICWPEIWPTIKPLIDQVLQNGESTWNEDQLIPIYRNGKIEDVYWTFSHSPVEDDNGITAGVLVVCNETTEKVKNTLALKESEETLSLAIESGNLGTYVLDLVNDELTTSPRMDEIFGFDSSTHHSKYLDTVYEDDIEIRNRAFQQAMDTGSLEYEVRVILKNSELRWIKVNGKIYKDVQQKPVKIIGLIQDITEQKKLERQKDDFIKVVSHELKTPLTSLFGYSELLIEKCADEKDDESLFMLGRMRNQTLRLTRIIQDMLDATRIEENKIWFRKDFFDIGSLISQITEEVQIINPGHQIVIDENECIEICADKERTSQVLTNILSNAIKYSPKASKIIVRYFVQGNEVVCSVQDFGQGIPPENSAKIFERFYQVKTANSLNHGIGMGLYISSEIIKRQHGRIWVESNTGEGSTFFFTLPLNAEKTI